MGGCYGWQNIKLSQQIISLEKESWLVQEKWTVRPIQDFR